MRERIRTTEEQIKLLKSLLRRRNPREGKRWRNGTLARTGHSFLVADGLGSWSIKATFFTPWLPSLRRALVAIDPAAARRGLSYSRVARHYGPANTDQIALRSSKPARLMGRYVPSDRADQAVTYVCFSLGCDGCLLGLKAWLEEHDDPSGAARRIRALVMVQPALELGKPYLEAAKQMADNGEELPTVVAEFLQFGEDVHQALREAVVYLRSFEIPVYLVYWPQDGFAVYPDAVVSSLARAGVAPGELPSAGIDPAVTDAFHRHCLVAKHDGIHGWLKTFLSA